MGAPGGMRAFMPRRRIMRWVTGSDLGLKRAFGFCVEHRPQNRGKGRSRLETAIAQKMMMMTTKVIATRAQTCAPNYPSESEGNGLWSPIQGFSIHRPWYTGLPDSPVVKTLNFQSS